MEKIIIIEIYTRKLGYIIHQVAVRLICKEAIRIPVGQAILMEWYTGSVATADMAAVAAHPNQKGDNEIGRNYLFKRIVQSLRTYELM